MNYTPEIKKRNLNKALFCAVAAGMKEQAEVLIKDGADPHADNDKALRIAKQKGYKEIVAMLENCD